VDSSPELSFICGISLCVWETSIIVSFAGSFLSLLSLSLPIDATVHGTFWPFDLVKGESHMSYCALPQYPKYRELSRLCSDNMLSPFGRENPGTGTKANCIQSICSCLVVERIPSTGTKADCAWTIRSCLVVEKIPSKGTKTNCVQTIHSRLLVERIPSTGTRLIGNSYDRSCEFAAELGAWRRKCLRQTL
jgi:hypothetical protein